MDVLSINRVSMFEFLEATHSYLIANCQQCRLWMSSAVDMSTSVEEPSTLGTNDDKTMISNDQSEECGKLLEELVLSVQRVIFRHKMCVRKTDENAGEKVCVPSDTITNVCMTS